MALSNKDKDELFQLRLKSKIDPRMTACRVNVSHASGNETTISGYTQYPQTDAFVKTLAKEIFATGDLGFSLKILERGKPKFAVVLAAMAAVWRNPDSTDPKQLDTEALYGTVLRVYHREGEFTFVQLPDGYVGYTPTTALRSISYQDYLNWKNGRHALTLVPLQALDQVIPVGSRLGYSAGELSLPDGQSLKIQKKQVVIFEPADPAFAKKLRQRAQAFMDSPYLWGGKTEVGIDCSGFVQTLFAQEGIMLPRDASMQCNVGEMVGYLPDYEDLLPGDVMFFMNENAFIFHVGIYLGDHKFMHSAGKTGPIISSVFPDGENYMKRYGSAFVYARRIRGSILRSR